MAVEHISKASIYKDVVIGKICTIIGCFFMFFGGVGVIADLTQNIKNASRDTLIVFLVFIVISIILLLRGRRIKLRYNRFKQYKQILFIENERYLSKVSIATMIPEDVVIKDFKSMILKKYFKDAYVDLEKRRVVFTDDPVQIYKTNSSSENMSEDISTGNESIVVECSGCGAKNKVIAGNVINCEFCGAPIIT